jgi:hypothetical protein
MPILPRSFTSFLELRKSKDGEMDEVLGILAGGNSKQCFLLP